MSQLYKIVSAFIFLVPIILFAQKKELSTSVIIPCYYKHAIYLESLLEEFSEQSCLPDEVVISISEADKVEPGLIQGLEETLWPFSLVIQKTHQQKYAGENRNIAAQHASKELLICQDADDLPHPQRIEIIKHFFEKNEIDFLAHMMFRSLERRDQKNGPSLFKEHRFSKANIKYTFLPKYDRAIPGRRIAWIHRDLKEKKFLKCVQKIPKLGSGIYNIHCGNTAFKREVFEQVKWTNLHRGQDVEFIKNVRNIFSRVCVISTPLLYYLPERSSNDRARQRDKKIRGS